MRIVLYILLIFTASPLWAQTMLVVEKPGTVNRQIYYAGDHIQIKTKDGLKISGPINLISDSSIVIDYVNTIDYENIEAVYKSTKLLNLFGTALLGGGIMYISLDLLNGGYRHKSVVSSQNFWIASGIVVTGTVMKIFSRKKQNLTNGKYRIKVLKP